MPIGNVRCGFSVSPAEYVANCQPSYAHSTPIIAMPIAGSSAVGVTSGAAAAVAPLLLGPATSSAVLITTIAPTFSAVVQVCTVALLRVPIVFTTAASAIIPSAAAFPVNGV